MQTNEKLIGILNDLVEINNDRIEGYQKASDETKEEDMDLKAIFAEMGNKSKSFAA